MRRTQTNEASANKALLLLAREAARERGEALLLLARERGEA